MINSLVFEGPMQASGSECLTCIFSTSLWPLKLGGYAIFFWGDISYDMLENGPPKGSTGTLLSCYPLQTANAQPATALTNR